MGCSSQYFRKGWSLSPSPSVSPLHTAASRLRARSTFTNQRLWLCLDILSIFTWTLWDRIPFMSYNQWCFALNINNIDTESKGACICNWQKVFLKFLQLRGITQSNLTISSGDVSSPLKVLRQSLKVSQQPKWEFENLFLSPNGGVSSIETW